MLDFESLAQGPIPAVDPELVRRWWSYQSQHAKPGVSFSVRVISQVCELEATDPLAVWARTAIISVVVQKGALATGELPDTVYEAAAVFPLPEGLEHFDPDEFVKTLNQNALET